MVVTLYEILIALLMIGLLRGLWRLTDRSPLVPALGGAALLVYAWPWIVGADWWAVARWLAGLAVAGAIVLAYARVVGRLRRAADRAAGERNR